MAVRGLAIAATRERLLAGDPVGASTNASSLTKWPSLPGHAAAAAALAAVLSGDGGEIGARSLEAQAAMDLGADAVLESAFGRAVDGHDAPVAAHITALACVWRHPLAPLWTAALALEAGDEGPSLRIERESPSLLGARGLGIRIREVLAARRAGARTLARDRFGRLVCWTNEAGQVVLAPDIAVDLVPAALVAAVASAADGASLRLSLDLDASRLALQALTGHRGTIVLLDPGSGAILAAVSDPLTLRKGGTPALEQQREPASISKLITTAAALRAGLDPDRFVAERPCKGSAHYEGGTLWCPHEGILSGIDEAMARSCNIAFADLGIAVGRQALLDELRRFGFDAPADELLGAAGHVVTPNGNERQLADLAIGLEATEITPLHAALLPTVVANEGRMPEPTFIQGSEGVLGITRLPRAPRPSRPVLDPAFVPTLRRAMEAVALYGTGAGVAPEDFPVAMKTGTAAAWGSGYHVNYVGLAPLPRPAFAFCVRLTHASSSHVVGRNARTVLHDLLAALAARERERAARHLDATVLRQPQVSRSPWGVSTP